jgi:hypothetical protein
VPLLHPHDLAGRLIRTSPRNGPTHHDTGKKVTPMFQRLWTAG